MLIKAVPSESALIFDVLVLTWGGRGHVTVPCALSRPDIVLPLITGRRPAAFDDSGSVRLTSTFAASVFDVFDLLLIIRERRAGVRRWTPPIPGTGADADSVASHPERRLIHQQLRLPWRRREWGGGVSVRNGFWKLNGAK